MAYMKSQRPPNLGKDGGISHAGNVIHKLVKSGDITSLMFTMQFREAQKNINFRNKKGLTPLMAAAAGGSWDSCRCLLRYRPEFLPKKCPASHAPWLLATEAGDARLAEYLRAAYREECLNGLTKNLGSQLIHERCSKERSQFTPSDMEELKWLLSQFGGSLVNYTDSVMRDPPLVCALRAGNEELAEYMVSRLSVDLFKQDSDSDLSVLHIAIEKRLPVRYLITEKNPQLLVFIDQDRRTPFFLACLRGDTEYVEWVVHKLLFSEQHQSLRRRRQQAQEVGDVAVAPPLHRLVASTETAKDRLSPELEAPHESIGGEGLGSNSSPSSRRVHSTLLSGSEATTITTSSSSSTDSTCPLPQGRGNCGGGGDEVSLDTTTSTASTEDEGEESVSVGVESVDLSRDVPDGGGGVEGRSTDPPEDNDDSGGSDSSLRFIKLSLDPNHRGSQGSSQGEGPEEESAVWKAVVEESSLEGFFGVKASAFVTSTDIHSDSVFHVLARQGRADLVQLIFTRGRANDPAVSPTIFLQRCGPTKGEYTPLQLAIEGNHPLCLQVMLEHLLELPESSADGGLVRQQLQDLQMFRVALCNGFIEPVKVLVRLGLWYEEMDDPSLYSIANRKAPEMYFVLVSLCVAKSVLKAHGGHAPFDRDSSSSSGDGDGDGEFSLQWNELFLFSLHPRLFCAASAVVARTRRLLLSSALPVGGSPGGGSGVGGGQPTTTSAGGGGGGPQSGSDDPRSSGASANSLVESHAFLRNVGEMCLSVVSEQMTQPPLSLEQQQQQKQKQQAVVAVPRCWTVEDFHRLTNIACIDLQHNELTEVPVELFLLPQLKELNLSHNRLQCLPSPRTPHYYSDSSQGAGQDRLVEGESPSSGRQATYACHRLEKLDLSHNSLSGLPLRLFTLRSLAELDASHNDLRYLPLMLWLPQSSLQKLVLHHNQLSQLHCMSLELLVNSRHFIHMARACWEGRPLEVCLEATLDASLGAPRLHSSPSFYSSHFSEEESGLGAGLLPADDRRIEELSALFEVIREQYNIPEGLAESECEAGSPPPEVETLKTLVRRSKEWALSPTPPLSPETTPNLTESSQFLSSERCDSLSSPQPTSELVEPEAPLQQQQREKELGEVRALSCLRALDLSHNHFTSVPWDLPCLAPGLKMVDLSHNRIITTDLVCHFPPTVSKVVLRGCQLREVIGQPGSAKHKICGNFVAQVIGSLFVENWTLTCDHRRHPALPKLFRLDLSDNLCNSVPFASGDVVEEGGRADSNDIVFFPSLAYLFLNDNASLLSVSPSIYKLPVLNSLDISRTGVETFPNELGLCPKLLILTAEGTPLKADLQRYITDKNVQDLLAYLKSRLQNSMPYHGIKLMVVGDTAKGKTTLVQSLARKHLTRRYKELRLGRDGAPLSTEGVDISDWAYSSGRNPMVTFYTWDFGGQKEYYATHQVFLTRRSLYLLVFDAREGVGGIRRLRRWLDNIDSKAQGSPIVVVGTHIDQLQKSQPGSSLEELREAFHGLYHSSPAAHSPGGPAHHHHHHHQHYEGLQTSRLQLLNALDSAQVQTLRDYVYNFVLNHKLPAGECDLGGPLINLKVPQVHIRVEKFIRSWAVFYRDKNLLPIINREYFKQSVMDECKCSEVEVHQAASFLHSTGVLLHYTDAQLADLYFIDPQWLSTVLAKVVSIPDLPAFHASGFMETSALQSIFSNDKVLTPERFRDITGLMQRFDVALILDRAALVMLIPSLLPQRESGAQLMPASLQFTSSSSSSSSTSSSTTSSSLLPSGAVSADSVHISIKATDIAPSATWERTLLRKFFLKYIPEGFFPRLIARSISSGLALKLAPSLPGSLHWSCWSEGFALAYNNSEIMRVSSVGGVVPGAETMEVVGGVDYVDVSAAAATIEVEVAVLPPEDITVTDNFISEGWSELVGEESSRVLEKFANEQLSALLLETTTAEVQSVFEDWYPSFTWSPSPRDRQKKPSVSVCDCCPHCLRLVKPHRIDHQLGLKREGGPSESPAPAPAPAVLPVFYLFFMPHAAGVSFSGHALCCPLHGEVPVETVAPDVEFKDLYSTPLTDFCNIQKMKVLGKGGFGIVWLAEISSKENSERKKKVAIKEPILSDSTSSSSSSSPGSDHPAPAPSQAPPPPLDHLWTLYKSTALEARIMARLRHPHILSMVGLSLHPWSLLLEYAPLGDLKGRLETYRTTGLRFGRHLTLEVMRQIAEGMRYLHDSNIVYRDLKPGNVLVWKFPRGSAQWKLPLSVLVKIADYGISKRNTPWGIRAETSTPVFQPPEVAWQTSARNFTTHKFDVYSYGILLYCLYTGLKPYSEYNGPLDNYVQKGNRPTLPLKGFPGLQGMFELMCLCWSQKPHHRPEFRNILDLLSSPSFQQVLTAEGVPGEHMVTCALFRQIAPQRQNHFYVPVRGGIDEDEDSLARRFRVSSHRRRHSAVTATTQSIPMLTRQPMSNVEVTRLISTLHLPNGGGLGQDRAEEGKSQIWYATSHKEIIINDYTADTHQIVQAPAVILSMAMTDNLLWCGLKKGGVCVFDIDTTHIVAQTPPTEETTVTQVLASNEQKSVYALTTSGRVQMFPYKGLGRRVVAGNPPVELAATSSLQLCDQPLTCGCLVPTTQGSQLWCYEQREYTVHICSGLLEPQRKLLVPGGDPSLLALLPSSHMLLVSEEVRVEDPTTEDWDRKAVSHSVFLADRMLLVKVDPVTLKRAFLDFSLQSRSSSSSSSGAAGCANYITSLAHTNGTVYVGTREGKVLMVQPSSLDLLGTVLEPFSSAISCLLGLEGLLNTYDGKAPLERRERARWGNPLNNLHDDEKLLVAFGMGYKPTYERLPHKPQQLLMPVVYKGDSPPDPRESSLSSTKHPRVDLETRYQMVVFDVEDLLTSSTLSQS